MADGSFDIDGGDFYRVSFTIDAGTAPNSGELDIGSGTVLGLEIQTTAGTSLTDLELQASSTKGGTKRDVYTSTGGQVAISFGYDRCIGLHSNYADAVAPWKYIQLSTTRSSTEGATTAAISGVICVKA